MLTRRFMLVSMALAGFSLTGVRRALADGKLNIVTTTGYIADAVRQVGGEHVEVKALLGPGVDPHLYRQTSSDIAAAAKADVVFWHGIHLEAQLQAFLEGLSAHKPVIALAEAVPRNLLLNADANAALPDPHIWFDPHLWGYVVNAARDALIRLRPENAADFEINAKRYLAEIQGIAEYASASLASVPASSRVLVTAHDAFSYFARAYHFDVEGIQGISTESEAGLRRIEELVEMLVKRNIGAVFVESSVSDRNVKALIEGAAAKGHKVVIGGELFSDATGEAGTYEGTYIGVIDHNATVITRALGGKAPEKGLSGRLASL